MKVTAAFLTLILFSGITLSQQNAPTLRIVTEDPTLPSELYYGDVRVKPVRLRPGTSQQIVFEDNDMFVQQHYIDFLQRFPDPAGFQGWTGVLDGCDLGGRLGSNNPACDRVAVSSAFFRSPEFIESGYLVYRYYEAALGRQPLYNEFMPDMRRVSGFQTDEQREANKRALMQEYTQRAEFAQKYAGTSNAEYVDRLGQTAGVPLANRQDLVNKLNAGQMTRAEVLRNVIQNDQAVYNKFYNKAFVFMQYFGYLRRDPDILALEWVRILNQTGDYRQMVFNFIYSGEYRARY